MYRIALCDDNSEYLKILKKRVKKYLLEKELKAILDVFDDSDLLAERIEENKGYDAYILDIEMPNVSGIDLAKILRQYSPNAYVIFLTAYPSYAIQGYGVNVVRYLLKQELDQVLAPALDELFEMLHMHADESTYTINSQRKFIKFYQKDIMYVYKYKKNAVFAIKGRGEELERDTLQNVFKKLNNPDMFFLDRGYILNMKYISKVGIDFINMDNDHKIVTSRERASILKGHLMSYLEREA